MRIKRIQFPESAWRLANNFKADSTPLSHQNANKIPKNLDDIGIFSSFVLFKNRKMIIFYGEFNTKTALNIFKYKEFQCKMRMV